MQEGGRLRRQINLRSGSNFYVSATRAGREARALERGRFIAMNVFGGILLVIIAIGSGVLLWSQWAELGPFRAAAMVFIGASVIGLLCLPALVRWQLQPIWIVERRDDAAWLTMGREARRVRNAVAGVVEMTAPPGSEGRMARCTVVCVTDEGAQVEVVFVGLSAPQAGEEAAALAAAITRLNAM